jgi:hypothetical protein
VRLASFGPLLRGTGRKGDDPHPFGAEIFASILVE